jgi:hypothetical protein
MNQVERGKSFNWMGLLFGGAYYAGYGKMGKGIAMGVISVFPLTAIMVSFYAGFKASKELPVGTQAFNWGKAIAVYCIMGAIIGLFAASLPSDDLLDDVSGYWQSSTKEEVMIDFLAERPKFGINGQVQVIEIVDVDTDEERLSFKMNNDVVATLIQNWDASGESFNLTLMIPQTKPIRLAFVRRL